EYGPQPGTPRAGNRGYHPLPGRHDSPVARERRLRAPESDRTALRQRLGQPRRGRLLEHHGAASGQLSLRRREETNGTHPRRRLARRRVPRTAIRLRELSNARDLDVSLRGSAAVRTQRGWPTRRTGQQAPGQATPYRDRSGTDEGRHRGPSAGLAERG